MGSIETILDNIDRNRYGVPDDWVPNEKKKSASDTTSAASATSATSASKKGKGGEKNADTKQSSEEDTPEIDKENDMKKDEDMEDKKDEEEEQVEKEGENDDTDEEKEVIPIYVKARQLFNDHEVLADVELKWTECQPEELTKFLVDEMGFSAERVQSSMVKLQKAFKATPKPQMRMDSFFKPLPSASTKNKGKKKEDCKTKAGGTKRKGAKLGGTKPAAKKSSFARRR